MINRQLAPLLCLALAVCPSLLVSAPAHAEWLHWNSGIEFGGGPFPPRTHALYLEPPRSGEARFLQSCMDAETLVLSLEDRGYDDIRVNRYLAHDQLTIGARSGYRAYVLRVDACSGDILHITRLAGGY
jgi:hypothetical protein